VKKLAKISKKIKKHAREKFVKKSLANISLKDKSARMTVRRKKGFLYKLTLPKKEQKKYGNLVPSYKPEIYARYEKTPRVEFLKTNSIVMYLGIYDNAFAKVLFKEQIFLVRRCDLGARPTKTA